MHSANSSKQSCKVFVVSVAFERVGLLFPLDASSFPLPSFLFSPLLLLVPFLWDEAFLVPMFQKTKLP